MKKKLILIAICLIIIISIFVRNIIIEVKQKNNESTLTMMTDEKVVTRAQAAKMFSYLVYTKDECEALEREISYSDTNKKLWYDKYINACYTLGLYGNGKTENKKFRPFQYLTYGDCKDILEKLVIAYNDSHTSTFLTYETIVSDLDFKLNKAKENDKISSDEFLVLYKTIVTYINNNLDEIKKEEKASSDQVDQEEWNNVEEKKLFLVGTNAELTGLEEWELVTDQGSFSYEGLQVAHYIDSNMKVLAFDKEILYVEESTNEEATLNNVWILSNEGKKITVYLEGVERTFTAENPLTEHVNKVIGDLVVENKKVVKLRIKPDIINSKVIVANDKYIELEKYGKIYLDDNYRIYKTYQDLTMELTNGILVGYDNTDFVVSNGKICAALIKDTIHAENLRVLIKTNNYEDIFHSKIKLTANTNFTIGYGKQSKFYKAGKVVTIKASNKMLKSGRLVVKTNKADGKIKIVSLTRGYGHPEYRGTMEISKNDGGLILVNELSLEEYLYTVVPSEMPSSYGLEALKVQAICARTYAYKQLLENNYRSYGAHIDDSASYQVYNNMPESKESILAVKDTYGKILEYKDEIISAYYFSTSCGYTSSAFDVWGTDKNLEYLSGKLQVDDEVVETISNNKTKKLKMNLTNEENFRDFITNSKYDTFDKSFAWYRWKTTISKKDLRKSVDQNLLSRYYANPNLIQTLAEGKGKNTYKSIPIATVGDIKEIQIANRGTGGIVNEVILIGTKNTIKVSTEYNIRTLFAPLYDKVVRKDKSEVSSLSMLPSAFFMVNENKKKSGFTFIGGGYGHGVGMSQNGAKAMADDGKTYDEILKYYYKGISIHTLYGN